MIANSRITNAQQARWKLMQSGYSFTAVQWNTAALDYDDSNTSSGRFECQDEMWVAVDTQGSLGITSIQDDSTITTSDGELKRIVSHNRRLAGISSYFGVDALWERCCPSLGIAVVRDQRYLGWRYADGPRSYHLFEWRDRLTGDLLGWAVVREDGADWEIVDLLALARWETGLLRALERAELEADVFLPRFVGVVAVLHGRNKSRA